MCTNDNDKKQIINILNLYQGVLNHTEALQDSVYIFCCLFRWLSGKKFLFKKILFRRKFKDFALKNHTENVINFNGFILTQYGFLGWKIFNRDICTPKDRSFHFPPLGFFPFQAVQKIYKKPEKLSSCSLFGLLKPLLNYT